MKWDHSADCQLLLNILETHKFNLDYEAIARKMGRGCNARTVYTRILKLRKNVEKAPLRVANPRVANPRVAKVKKGKDMFKDDDEEPEGTPTARNAYRRVKEEPIDGETRLGQRRIKAEQEDVIMLDDIVKVEKTWRTIYDRRGEVVVIDD